MELRQVRAVLELAEHLHFGRAAKALGVTQSSLSQSLRALETSLGVTLFDRTTRSVTITEAGRTFVDQSASAVAALDAAARGAAASGRGQAGSLVIGLVGTVLTPPLPAVLRRFRARSPHVAITVRELTTGAQVVELGRGDVDIGFLRPPLPSPADRDLDLTTVARTPLVAALPREHRLAGVESLWLRSLADEPFVRTPRALGPGFHDHITALCRSAGFIPDTVQEATQIDSIVGLVSAGFGVAVVPARSRPTAGVSFVPIRDRDAVTELSMATPRRRPLSPQARAFATLVRDSVRPPGARTR